jgi:bacillithiol system protein YtxJ
MNWIELGTEQELLKLTEKSFTQPQAIFKHSTTCGTSFHVKMMLEDEVTPENIDFHYLTY